MSAATKTKHVIDELDEPIDVDLISDDLEEAAARLSASGDRQAVDNLCAVVQVLRPAGRDLHEVKSANGEHFLISMPPKFRQRVWIKRNSFALVTPILEGNRVKAELFRPLNKQHIREIKLAGKWPKPFCDEDPSDMMPPSGSESENEDNEDSEDENSSEEET